MRPITNRTYRAGSKQADYWQLLAKVADGIKPVYILKFVNVIKPLILFGG